LNLPCQPLELLATVVNALEARRQITQAPPTGTRAGFFRARVAPTLAPV
jgi:hypothetical protein